MKHIKKKINLKKQLKKKMQKPTQFQKEKLISLKSKRPSVTRRKGAAYFQHRSFTYRLPAILGVVFLFTFILIIPSLIVMPFGSNSERAESVDARDNEGMLEEPSEAVSVAVMRTQSDVVEDIPLENYIVGVVAAEMPADFEMEALKAQALTARTYAVSHLLDGEEEEEYDVTDTIQHQVYLNSDELEQQWGSGYAENMEKIKAAVEATQGEIITFDEEPIMPAYFSMSNGYTENSEDYWDNELPYLRSVPSPWDLDNPQLVSQETFTKDELEERLEIELQTDTDHDFSINRNESERVSEFTVGESTFTGREIRDRLELRSSDFSVEQNDEHVIFTTKGNGHGIGMSQYGADSMAKEGKTYEEIVKHYYQEVEINTVDEAAPALVSR